MRQFFWDVDQSNVKDDVKGREQYQETGQEKRPARMVGLQSLVSTFWSRDAQTLIHACSENGGRKR
jgi:hypothetical protein